MPAVLEAVNQPAAKPLDARLARAAGRIRMTDLLVGVLSLMVITLTYAAAMILIDRSAELPSWLRQMGFVAWLGSMAYVGYRRIVRPMTAVLNPLFVAKQVESAIPDAHNVVVNYVDLKERDLPASVRTAVEKQASSEVTDADVAKAGESRTLVGLGIAAAGLAVLLAVFFLAFSPAQFNSLVRRAFQPFASQIIVSKTRITIVQPADPNLTITAGTPVLLHVSLDGRLPAPDTDERTRLILRHNPDDPIGETVPFEPGATNREFVLKVPEYLVQNGFWYRIAAGDGETDEYRVTVRPRILLTNVRVKYDYPKYLRMPSETVDRPQIEAYRGTIVTVTATANRPVTGGRLMIDQQDVAIRGQAIEDGKVSFSFTVADSGTYKIFLTSADNETSIDPPVYPIKVITDNPPTVRIEKPEADEIELPLNGLLAIDAVADDDLGLAQLTTKVKLAGEGGKVLVDRPYRLSLKRDADGSYPTRVEIKESVKLAELAGLKEGDVLEYWIEATDNRELSESEKGQVGVSAVKKVKLTAIPKEPEKQQEQKRQGEQRQDQQQKHDQNQKQKMDGEKRPPPPGQKEKQENPEQNPDQKGQPSDDPMKGSGEANPMNPKPQEGGEKGSPMNPMEGGGEKGTPMNPKPMEGGGEKGSPMNPMGGEKPNPMNSKPQEGGGEKGSPMTTKPQEGGGEKGSPTNSNDTNQSIDPAQKQKLEEQANKVNKELGNKGGQPQSGGQQGGEMSAEQKQQLQDAAKDLNSSDPAKRAAAEKTIDNAIGKENREAAQKEAEQLKKDLQSNDPKTREAAKQKVEKMAEQMKQQGGGQEGGQKGGEMTPEQKEKFQQAAKDMASNDPAKKAAGEKAMDEMIGKQNREAAQKQADQIKKDLQSDDPKTREAAQKKLEQMANDIKKQQGGQGMSDQEKKDLAKAGEGMNSGNPMDKGSAEQKVDEALGQKERDAATAKAEQAKQDLKTGSDAQKADAAKQLEKIAQGNGEQQPKPGQGMSDKDKQDLAKAAQGLGSDDPAKRAAAEKAIDEKIGSDARKQAQKDADQLKKDLQSDDAKTREAAQQKLQQMANEMKKQGAGQPSPDSSGQKASNEKPTGGKPPSPEEMKQLRDAAKGLASDNPDEKAAAQKTLDEKIGEENRRKAEQMASDLKSNDPATRRAAEQKLKDMAQQANAGKPDGSGERKPTPEEIKKEQEKLANAAKDLTSKDDAARQKAEKELDDQIGEKNRKDVQQAMNDMQSGDPQKQQEGQKKLEEMMKQAQANAGKMNKDWKPGPGGGITGEKGGPALEDNPLDRLKTAELQLKTFKDNKTNKELLNKLQMNEQEYAEFVAGYEKLVETERKRITVAGKTGPGSEAPKTMNANRGGEKLGQRGEGTGPTGAAAGTAPPGYSDATRKFAEEAAKKGQSPK